MKVKFISKLLCIGALVFAQFGTANAQSFGVHGRVSDSKGEAVVEQLEQEKKMLGRQPTKTANML